MTKEKSDQYPGRDFQGMNNSEHYPSIGIGIVTYNRLEGLKTLLDCIHEFPPVTEGGYDIFVSDDGSTDGTQEFLDIKGIPYQSEKNRGISWNKNRIIAKFYDYDYVFIIEDDVEIIKEGWAALFINAMNVSRENHLSYVPDCAERYDSGEVLLHPYDHFCISENTGTWGGFLAFTKEALHKAGGFDTRFIIYGHEHSELTERIYRLGLNKYKYSKLMDADDYMRCQNIKTTTAGERGRHLLALNQVIYRTNAYCYNSKLCDLFKSPWPPIDFDDTCIPRTGIGILVSDSSIEQIMALNRYFREMTPELHDLAFVNIQTKQENPVLSDLKHSGIKIFNVTSLCGALHKNILLACFKNHEQIVLFGEDFFPKNRNWLKALLSCVSP